MTEEQEFKEAAKFAKCADTAAGPAIIIGDIVLEIRSRESVYGMHAAWLVQLLRGEGVPCK